MSRSDDERLLDISEAGPQVEALPDRWRPGARVADGKTGWDGDRVKQLAVERLIEMIGEPPLKGG